MRTRENAYTHMTNELIIMLRRVEPRQPILRPPEIQKLLDAIAVLDAQIVQQI